MSSYGIHTLIGVSTRVECDCLTRTPVTYRVLSYLVESLSFTVPEPLQSAHTNHHRCHECTIIIESTQAVHPQHIMISIAMRAEIC